VTAEIPLPPANPPSPALPEQPGTGQGQLGLEPLPTGTLSSLRPCGAPGPRLLAQAGGTLGCNSHHPAAEAALQCESRVLQLLTADTREGL